MARIQEIKEIPLKNLTIHKGQVRVRSVGKDIDELAESIRTMGLLEPIVVAPTDQDGIYEILTGQRRFLAHQKLGLETIHAVVLEEKVDETEAKVISLTENLIRRDLDNTDTIDACTALYKKYGSASAVARATGLPYALVNRYVKYDRLAPELRELVDTGEIDIKVALRAQDAASVTGEFNAEEGVSFAKELKPMSGAQQAQVVKQRQNNPDKPVDEVIEDAKGGERLTQVITTLGAAEHRALQAYAKEEGVNQDGAAAMLITDGLAAGGYLNEDAD